MIDNDFERVSYLKFLFDSKGIDFTCVPFHTKKIKEELEKNPTVIIFHLGVDKYITSFKNSYFENNLNYFINEFNVNVPVIVTTFAIFDKKTKEEFERKGFHLVHANIDYENLINLVKKLARKKEKPVFSKVSVSQEEIRLAHERVRLGLPQVRGHAF